MDARRGTVTTEELLAEMAWLQRLARRIAGQAELAEDAVQETMLAAVMRGPHDRVNIRGWLGTVLRNAVRKRAVKERSLGAREQSWAEDHESARSDTLNIDERFALEHDLSRAVLALDEGLRRIILLRFLEERSLREISERVGAPISTVEARLERALSILRWRLERSHGDDGSRRQLALLWPLYLGSLRSPPLVGRSSPWVIGAMASLAAAILATLVLSAAFGSSEARIAESVASLQVDSASSSGDTLLTAAVAPEEASSVPVRGSISSTAPTGSLELRFSNAEGVPARSMPVSIWPDASAAPIPLPEVTDADGRVLFHGLLPGLHKVSADRLLPNLVDVHPSEATRAAFNLGGPSIGGIVVDEVGLPIANAVVWVSALPGGALQDGVWMRSIVEDTGSARTDSEGGFTIPDSGAVRIIGARAPGRAASAPIRVTSDNRATPLRITLMPSGGSIKGQVIGPDARPVAGAVVLGDPSEPGNDLTAPFFGVRTDQLGGFELVGMPSGTRVVTVQAPGLPAWRGRVEVTPGGSARIDVTLVSGGTLCGVVSDANGEPIANAQVWCEPPGRHAEPTFAQSIRCRSGPDGTYELKGLGLGPLSLMAVGPSGASLSASVTVQEGETRELDLRLVRDQVVEGMILDDSGVPLANRVVVASSTVGDSSRTVTDARGSFTLTCVGPGTVRLRVIEAGWAILDEKLDVGPAHPRGPTRWTIPRAMRPTAVLRGRVVGATGHLLVRSAGHPSHQGVKVQTDAEGRFETDPLPPGRIHLTWVGPECEQTLVPDVVDLTLAEVRDLGDCTIASPGTVELAIEVTGHNTGESRGEFRAVIRREDDTVVRKLHIDGESSSFQLPSGSFTVLLWSPTTVPTLLPFDVRDGEETRVDAFPKVGTACELTILDPIGPRFHTLDLVIEDGFGASLPTLPVHPSFNQPGGGYRVRLGLAPGSYILRGKAGDGSVDERFLVGKDGPLPVQASLQ